MYILSIKFKSSLADEEAIRIARERLPEFQKIKGLIQKYYGYEKATGEFTGIYLWDSEESMKAYRESDLARTIPSAYKIEGQPRIEIFEVPFILRD